MFFETEFLWKNSECDAEIDNFWNVFKLFGYGGGRVSDWKKGYLRDFDPENWKCQVTEKWFITFFFFQLERLSVSIYLSELEEKIKKHGFFFS